MWKKFVQGLFFGSGAAIAFVAIWIVSASYVIPAAMKEIANQTPDMSGGKPADVIPLAEDGSVPTRQFELHKGMEHERKIPQGGGMLSIAVLPADSGYSRPSTFQAWVTESEAFIISTEGVIPTVKAVPYRSRNAVDYASTLVQENVGFVKQNLTMPINKSEVESLKRGKKSVKGDFYNGEFRITDNGAVFLLPNEYEPNKQPKPTP